MNPPAKLLEIGNPSDPYSISGDDEKAAILAALLLGSGWYALTDESGEQVLPIFIGGGFKQWIREKYGKDVEEWAESVSPARMVAAFDSVCIGSIKDRRELDRMLHYITVEAKRKAFLAERHDKHRSSMNDIGGRAQQYAEAYRKKIPPKKGRASATAGA